MRKQRPKVSEEEHVVLQFRPRGRAGLPRHRPPAGNAADARSPDKADDASPRRPSRDQPDDFSQRMLANAAAMAFTIALIAIGLWLAKNIADLRNIQDCAQMGLRGCAHISTPPP
ncbi:hypothetical protein GGQ85_003472 [Nitrobacter vulgaris]|uniref:hypothetical protein n=1 Tax=Nitrobacter vulgaris TaxID=29421 RepID=UPI002858025A|nr:hypothetical protein [Nitrobacter vulgaris]MDR6305748.1 hypothetical protein [Nitrobacter vulgaris]